MAIEPGPTIEIKGDERDGWLKGSAQFAVINPNDFPVDVTQVSMPCDCGKARVEPETIAPGGKATLSVDVKGARDYPQVATPVVFFDPPSVTPLRARVVLKPKRTLPYVISDRTGVDLGALDLKNPDTASFSFGTVEIASDTRCLRDARSSAAGILVTLEDGESHMLVENWQERRYVARLRVQNLPSGEYHDTIKLVDGMGQVVGAKLVDFSVPPPVACLPKELSFLCRMGDNKPVQHSVVVKSMDGGDLGAVRFEKLGETPWVSVERAPTGAVNEPNTATARVRCDPLGLSAGIHRAELQVTTEHPQQIRLVVAIEVLVYEGAR